MKSEKAIILILICLCFLMGGAPVAPADVSPGDGIDKSNWEKAEGLLPASILEWIKQGDIIHVAELEYSPAELFLSTTSESIKANVGKYDLDEQDIMVETKTGKMPDFIEGIPFPEIDPNDPKAGAKIMYNKIYYTYTLGNVRFPFNATWIGRNRGYEREVGCEWYQYPLDGYMGAKKESNPENIERYALIRVLDPFDIKGTNILLWRYRDKRQDSTFGYIPAIRRVRRMSPANRSDAFIGSDACVDDAWTFDGKVASFVWKLLRVQEALLPFAHTKVQPLEKNKYGEWQTTKTIKPIVYGYQKEGYQGTPWFPTNVVWVKRPTYVIEMKPKDPYYNYGTQHIWVDTDNYWCNFKVIHDRADKYWKTFWTSQGHFENADKKLQLVTISTQMAVDDRSRHCTIIEDCSPRNQWVWFAEQDRNDYSLGGFQKLCK